MTKPQIAAIEQDDPEASTDIKAEVATQLKAAQNAERAEARQDLEEAFWLAGIEAFSAIINALTPKPEITLTTQPADDGEALRKALLLIPSSKRESIKSMADVYAFHAAKGGK